MFRKEDVLCVDKLNGLVHIIDRYNREDRSENLLAHEGITERDVTDNRWCNKALRCVRLATQNNSALRVIEQALNPVKVLVGNDSRQRVRVECAFWVEGFVSYSGYIN